MAVKLLRLPELCEKTGYKKSTIWLKISKGEFPKQIKMSSRISVWLESEIDDWITKKILESK